MENIEATKKFLDELRGFVRGTTERFPDQVVEVCKTLLASYGIDADLLPKPAQKIYINTAIAVIASVPSLAEGVQCLKFMFMGMYFVSEMWKERECSQVFN